MPAAGWYVPGGHAMQLSLDATPEVAFHTPTAPVAEL